jgi:PAS domain S-box-containing protein
MTDESGGFGANELAVDALEREWEAGAVLEDMTDCFVRLDREWRITYANVAAEKNNGVSKEILLGRIYWEAFPAVVGTDFEQALRRAMTVRVPVRRKAVFYEPNGRSLELDIHPVSDGGLALYGRDVTERLRADAEIRRNEERFRRYFELGVIGMALTSPDKECLEVNDQLCKILGYSRDELLRMNWAEMTHPDDLASDVRQFNRVMAGEIDGYDLDKRWVRKDGRVIDTTISVKCVRSSDGSVDYFVAVLQDMTEKKAAQAALQEIEQRAEDDRKALLESERQARATAEQASRLKDEFLASLSHELRTPINAVLTWIHLLRHKRLDAAKIELALDSMERGVKAQVRLIDDLLDLSRITSGKLRLDKGPLDVAAVIRTALETVKASARAKAIRVHFRRRKREGWWFDGDAARLQQVFSNLLTNAIKFTPKGGNVEVRLAQSKGALTVSVRDTGQGIAPQLLQQIFEKFRQADGSAARLHGGLGLGLAIVKELVELHGGGVKAESEGEGRGATFVVSLPVAPDTRESGTNAAPPDAYNIDLAGTRIVFVDDDLDTQTAVVRMLEEHDGEIVTASSADEALAQLLVVRPHILISDIGMQGKDGYELIREIRRSPQHRRLRAIALTAFARPEDRDRTLSAGYDLHLTKPIVPTELLRAIGSLLDQDPSNDPPSRPETPPPPPKNSGFFSMPGPASQSTGRRRRSSR